MVRSWIQEIEAQEIEFEHPRDRNGVIENKRLSTVGVEKALNAYRNACAQAHSIVSIQALRYVDIRDLSWVFSISSFFSFLKRRKKEGGAGM